VSETTFKYVAADASAEKLWLANEAMQLIGESKVADAHQMLGRYASLQTKEVAACLENTSCAFGLGGEDRIKMLKALVNKHSKSGG
jgi:hypothetical protein